MTNSKLQSIVCTLALLLAATLLTTCGDDSSSSNDDRGVYGDMADVLQEVEDTVLVANAALYASMDSLLPHITAALDLSSSQLAASAVPNSCLPEGTGGQRFTFNGETYTGQTDPLVQSYTARFDLYRISASGQPMLDQTIGYVDLTCADLGVPVTEIQLFNGTTLVGSTTYSPTSGLISGTLRSPNAAVSLTFMGDEQEQGYVFFSFIADSYEVHAFGYETPSLSTHAFGIKVNDAPNGTAPEIFFEIDVVTNAISAQVTGGDATYTEGPITRGAACILSGTIESPVFTRPTGACFSEDVELLSINSAERAAMLEIFQAARAYWLRAWVQVELCRSLLPE